PWPLNSSIWIWKTAAAFANCFWNWGDCRKLRIPATARAAAAALRLQSSIPSIFLSDSPPVLPDNYTVLDSSFLRPPNDVKDQHTWNLCTIAAHGKPALAY